MKPEIKKLSENRIKISYEKDGKHHNIFTNKSEGEALKKISKKPRKRRHIKERFNKVIISGGVI